MDANLVYGLQSLIGRYPAVDALGIFLATALIWVELAAAGCWWLAARRRRLLAAASALISAGLAWVVSQGIGLLWFRPRPFADLAGVKLLIVKSALDKSFPSDHATLAFALAGAVYLADRRWGAWFLVVAALVSLGRVYVGVHYPSDVLAGAVLGLLSAYGVHRLIHLILRTRHQTTRI